MVNLPLILLLARKNQNLGEMVSSAKLCLQDAEELFDAGKTEQAVNRALESLAYSVGILHDDYLQAFAMSGHTGAARLRPHLFPAK